ncbi:MAG: hypothetical protein ACYC7E_04240 [Armatimonadota bacterium]
MAINQSTDAALAGWERLDMTLPDIMPYYPARPVNHPEWSEEAGVLQAESRDWAWSYLLRGEENDADYTLEFDFLLPAMVPDRTEYFGMNILGYRPGEFEPCWETCAVVRYTDRDHFYRIAFSTLAGDGNGLGPGGAVALWSPAGGFLQVVPFCSKPFAWRRVKIVTAGPVIEVWVDGELVIHYRDTVAPVTAGRYGIGVFGEQFYRFKDIRQSANTRVLPAEQATYPGKEAPHFRLGYFLRQQFLFCNNEPIGRIDPATSLIHEVRLRSGYKPLTMIGLHWDQYNGPRNTVDVKEEWTVEKTNGPEFAARYRFRNPGSNVYCNGRLTVSYDPRRETYLWELDTTVEVAPGQTWKYDHFGLSFADPVPYDHIPPAVEVVDPWQCRYEWIVFQAPDGNYYRHPMLHNHVPPIPDQMKYKSDGGLAVLMHDPLGNLALEFDFDPALRPAWWLCPWAYDIHFLINPYEKGYEIPGGTQHHVKFRYLSVHGEEAQRIFDASTVHPYFATLPDRLIFTGGVNTFALTKPCTEPQAEYFWDGGERDEEVGHDDHYSLRLCNDDPGTKQCSAVGIGGSNFMGRFTSRRYRLTGWIRTRGVQGNGAALFARSGENTAYSQRVSGDSEWTKVEIETELLYSILMASIGVELDGTGTAWLDDFLLERL